MLFDTFYWHKKSQTKHISNKHCQIFCNRNVPQHKRGQPKQSVNLAIWPPPTALLELLCNHHRKLLQSH